MAKAEKLDMQKVREAAERYCRQIRGYEILERDYSYGGKTIDLIVKDENCIRFIELNAQLVDSEEMKEFDEIKGVSSKERSDLERIAQRFLLFDYEGENASVTFDRLNINCSSTRGFFQHWKNILQSAA